MTAQERLQGLRRRAGLTQMALADLAGISQPTISGIEAGKHGIGVEVAKKLAAALGVDWTVFFDQDSRQVDNAS